MLLGKSSLWTCFLVLSCGGAKKPTKHMMFCAEDALEAELLALPRSGWDADVGALACASPEAVTPPVPCSPLPPDEGDLQLAPRIDSLAALRSALHRRGASVAALAKLLSGPAFPSCGPALFGEGTLDGRRPPLAPCCTPPQGSPRHRQRPAQPPHTPEPADDCRGSHSPGAFACASPEPIAGAAGPSSPKVSTSAPVAAYASLLEQPLLGGLVACAASSGAGALAPAALLPRLREAAPAGADASTSLATSPAKLGPALGSEVLAAGCAVSTSAAPGAAHPDAPFGGQALANDVDCVTEPGGCNENGDVGTQAASLLVSAGARSQAAGAWDEQGAHAEAPEAAEAPRRAAAAAGLRQAVAAAAAAEAARERAASALAALLAAHAARKRAAGARRHHRLSQGHWSSG